MRRRPERRAGASPNKRLESRSYGPKKAKSRGVLASDAPIGPRPGAFQAGPLSDDPGGRAQPRGTAQPKNTQQPPPAKPTGEQTFRGMKRKSWRTIGVFGASSEALRACNLFWARAEIELAAKFAIVLRTQSARGNPNGGGESFAANLNRWYSQGGAVFSEASGWRDESRGPVIDWGTALQPMGDTLSSD